MINGIGIPVLTPYKFYPADATTGDGVNFQNVDNTERTAQSWSNVWANKFAQPVPRYWNDLTYGIDFQILLDTNTLSFANFSAELRDSDDVKVNDLSTVDFFTSGTDKYVRVIGNELSVEDGCYKIALVANGSTDVYYSEWLEIKNTHQDCYPLEYSNFENDFGLIFENASNETWKGKLLVRMRIYEPVPREEKESYINDPGEVVTLRSVPQRYYSFQTYAVATWFAEKFKLIFNCSELELNKSVVNTEENPELELIEQSDMIEIAGEVALNTFVDEYIQEDNLDTVVEKLTSWANTSFDTFTSSGKDVTSAIRTSAGSGFALSNSISVTADEIYMLRFDVTGTVVGGQITFGAETFTLLEGENVYFVEVPSTTSYTVTLLASQGSNFSAECFVQII